MAFSVSLVVPNASASTPSPEEWTQEQIDARYSAYRQRINQLLDEGKNEVEVNEIISDEFDIVSLSIPVSLAGSDTHIQLLRSTAESAPSSQTSAADIRLYAPTFSYDNYLRHYVMAASWVWKNCADYNRACWTKDKGSKGNVGGPDGMAIKINRPVVRKGGGISTSDNCGTPKINNTYADTDNGYGLGFIEQDAVGYDSANGMCAGTPFRYNWHRGTVSEIFDFNPNYPSCTKYQIQVDAKIGHTWSTTSVDSIGISGSTTGGGITYRWSRSDHRWNAIPVAQTVGSC